MEGFFVFPDFAFQPQEAELRCISHFVASTLRGVENYLILGTNMNLRVNLAILMEVSRDNH